MTHPPSLRHSTKGTDPGLLDSLPVRIPPSMRPPKRGKDVLTNPRYELLAPEKPDGD
jgi:hypothetical protein